MSNTQFAFLNKTAVPDRTQLQAAIDALGFDLQLDPAFTPFADRGFSPCVLRGQAGAGFEIFYDPSNAVVEEDEEDFWEIIGTNDYCLSFVWHSSEADAACVMIVCAALAQAFGAVVSFEGDEPDSADTLLAAAKKMLAALPQ
ncbi:hypothetical protein KFZ76_20500 [Methylovulum psychrotolerans]|uniref:hypothetical protein n=1 Tax=Methylovulum psychrotolerans TaxID=1704499 RepID=UPI001BFF7DB9|nr:hypothetical protein [Methylovulum psychrotolerans]MBT9100087.1 hypothetical protein [Methylovulum psychrotolerans]